HHPPRPSAVAAPTIAALTPATLTNVTWTSSTSCNASVSPGATRSPYTPPSPFNVAAGAGNAVTFTVTGTVAPTATGDLVNTASVTAPPGTSDPNGANNSATDTDSVSPSADLQITKTDNSATYTPGAPITYTITVTNPTGPTHVSAATIADLIPATLTNVTWTSSTTGNASVSAGGSGSGNNLAATVNI